MKTLYSLLVMLILSTTLPAQIFPPSSCYNNDFQLELSVTGNQITCNDSFFIAATSVGNPVVYWSDGFIGDSRWITYPGFYQAYAFDNFGCVDTTEGVFVDVNLNYATAASASFLYKFCEGDSLLLNGFAAGTPQWNNGLTGSSVYVNAPGIYNFTAVDPNGCTVVSNDVEVFMVQRPQPVLSTSGDIAICQGDSIVVSATGPGSINWVNAWGPGNTVTLTQTGYYYAYTFDSTGFCIGYSDTINLTVREPFLETLCFVTVDSATGKNMLLWNNTADEGTVSYNVYTESNVLGQYTLLGNVPFGTTGYIHTGSIPEQQPYRYYIAAVDTCGNENGNAMFYLHGTIHLTSSLGVNGQNNLNWSQYFGNFPVFTYEIFRSNNFGPFTQIASLSASFNSFSDIAPPAGNNRYFVGVQSPNCGNFSSNVARSNTVSNQATTGINTLDAASVKIQPIEGGLSYQISGLSGFEGVPMQLFSQDGKQLFSGTVMNEREIIDLGDYARGIYLLRIAGISFKLLR